MSGKTPYILIILDGWGHRDESEANAIRLARSPVWDGLWQDRPHCLISSSGLDVGLPAGQMGNSEVGHMSLGTGRIVAQDFTRINQAIETGQFFDNPVLKQTTRALAESGKTLHLFGLLSPGGVHSHENHIKAMVKLAFDEGVTQVFLHAFLDGRDVPPRSASESLRAMQAYIGSLGKGGITSVIGRYYAMDRDNRWNRIALAYDLLTTGSAEFVYGCPLDALQAAYDRNESDEFVKASTIQFEGKTIQMADGDAVIFMNFRADRARQITRAFVDENFDGFTRKSRIRLSQFVMLTEYAPNIDSPSAFRKSVVKNGLGEYISALGKSQLRIAETEKYAHVTFFFSGGREQPFEAETRCLVPSPKVATYDLQPAMSAVAVTDKLVEAITSRKYELIVCNFANGDMVGHTGNLDAAIVAVECVDVCLGRIVQAILSTDGHCLITADHGNVEQMSDETSGQAHTAHTSDPVPLVYVGSRNIDLQQSGGILSDVAPTLLDIMKLPQPEEMTGKSLLKETYQGVE